MNKQPRKLPLLVAVIIVVPITLTIFIMNSLYYGLLRYYRNSSIVSDMILDLKEWWYTVNKDINKRMERAKKWM
jgi:hypothetical protein